MEVLLAGFSRGLQQTFWNRRAHACGLSIPRTQHAQQAFIRSRGLDLAQFVSRGQSRQPAFRYQAGQTAAGNSADQPGGELRGIHGLKLGLLNWAC